MSLILILFFLLIPFSAGQAASPQVLASLGEKVERWDVAEAWKEMEGLLNTESRDPQVLEMAAQIAFHRGEYGEARKFMQSALEIGGEDGKRRGFSLFVESTLGVLSSFQKHESPHFIIHLDEKQDGILADYLKDNLERTYRVMAERSGFRPEEKIRVEVFPVPWHSWWALDILTTTIL